MYQIEKIYCCDKSDNAVAAAIMANGYNRNNDNCAWPMMASLMGGGMNNWMNNPFAYMMMFALFRNGWGGWGDGFGNGQNAQNVEMMNQLQAIRSQMQDNQNSNLLMDAIKGNDFALSQLSQNLQIDFNTLQKCCCDVQAAIQNVAGQSASPPNGSSMQQIWATSISSSNSKTAAAPPRKKYREWVTKTNSLRKTL